MNETQNTPELRFEGFTEPWKQHKLRELARIRTGFPFNSKDFSDDGHYRVITNANIQDNVSDVNASLGNRIDIEDEQLLRDYGLDIGDILVTMDGTVGRTAKVADDQLILAQRVGRLSAHKDREFLYQVLNSGKFSNDMATLSHGGTIKHISLEEIGSFLSLLPDSSKEQHLVGCFFSGLDSFIAFQQRKYERLQHLKQALLRKMFPKPGGQVPELRFDGFTEPWEERKLGELIDITSVRRVHQKDWCNSGVRFLRARDVVAYSKGEEVDDPLYISTAMYAEYSAQCGKVQKNDLLVTGVGTIGIPWLVPNDNPVYFKDGNIIWLKNRNALDGRFLYYDFMGTQIQTFIHETTGIGTVATFTIDTACKTPIIYPSQSEQHLIGSFFRDLDNLIALYRHKYERLKRLKQALLRKMFV